MKPTSSLSLLLFLSLTTAAPIPSELSKDCLHNQPWFREIFSSPPTNGHTPPTKLATPHFPDHQLRTPSASPESHRQIEEAFNNAPLTPPKGQKPSIALSGGRPLQSSYLLSLSNPALKNPPQGEPQSSSTDALPAKPTSALPKLREEDDVRYWATVDSDEKGEVVISDGTTRTPGCGDHSKLTGSSYMRVGQPVIMAREYSDLLVVGIVVLFLAAVVVLEAVEYCSDLRSICGNMRRRQRRGEIFLEDEESAACIVKKTFYLQPAPLSKYKTPLTPVQEVGPESEKEECYRD